MTSARTTLTTFLKKSRYTGAPDSTVDRYTSAMTSTPANLQLDIAILGGGVAGLWLLERLRQRGYQAALFSQGPLGAGQTIAAQGMLHGGGKYRLRGNRASTATALQHMPALWRACLAGHGEVDLTQTLVASEDFYLWANTPMGKLSGRMAHFVLGKQLHKMLAADWPDFLRSSAHRALLYRLTEQVIDVPSLIRNLAVHNTKAIFQLPRQMQWQRSDTGICLALGTTRISARRWVLTAGSGNEDILRALGYSAPAMQRRPLQQVLVRHPALPRFFGHCLSRGSTPRLSISSHQHSSGDTVWYLGGALAERGAAQSPTGLIADAQAELARLFPSLDLQGAHYSTLAVERAEPHQPDGSRPAGAFVAAVPEAEEVLVAWPTKLTLAPALAQRIVNLLPPPDPKAQPVARLADFLLTPSIATPPWEMPQ